MASYQMVSLGEFYLIDSGNIVTEDLLPSLFGLGKESGIWFLSTGLNQLEDV